MAKWANEDAYNAIVEDAASAYGVPSALIKAIIAQESGFNPQAYRPEVAINDASRGLMQLLLSTAKGEGYDGAGDGLFDPATNVDYGTSYLAGQLSRVQGNIADAVSAYNGGYRPSLGFGAVATQPLRLCLARDAKGTCISYRNVPIGEYGNQTYVNNVLSYYRYFLSKQASPVSTGGTSVPVSPTSSGSMSIPLAVGNQHSKSQADCRDCGTSTRTFRDTIQKTVVALCKKLFQCR